MSIKAVIFDVFDTLVANGPDLWLNSFRRICQSQSLSVEPQKLWDSWIVLEREFRHRRLDPETLQLHQPFESYETAWTACFARTFQALGLRGDPEAATRLCIEGLGQRPFFPETLKVLEGLNGALKLGVLSNADRSFLYPLLDYHSIREKFSAILCSEEVLAYKPHPSLFYQILERLGVAPGEALHVGDTLHEDVRGAKLVGMKVAWVNRAGTTPDSALPQADYQVQTLTELLAVVPGGV